MGDAEDLDFGLRSMGSLWPRQAVAVADSSLLEDGLGAAGGDAGRQAGGVQVEGKVALNQSRSSRGGGSSKKVKKVEKVE